MRIGFDIDGVLANFIPSYQKLAIEVAGKDLFDRGDYKNPPCWNWPEYRGYSKETMKEVWNRIKNDERFWMDLDPLPGVSTLRMCILDLQRYHEIYFVTSRVGSDVKWQTEQWLRLHLAIDLPTVLISSAKGLCAKALKLDCYLDDNADNVNDVVLKTLPEEISVTLPNILQPATRTYLLDASYNREPGVPEAPVRVDTRVTRVATLGKFLDAELQNL